MNHVVPNCFELCHLYIPTSHSVERLDPVFRQSATICTGMNQSRRWVKQVLQIHSSSDPTVYL